MVETKTMTEWNGMGQKVLQSLHEELILLALFQRKCRCSKEFMFQYRLLYNLSDRTMLQTTSSKTWIIISVRTHVRNSQLPETQFRQKWIGSSVSQLQVLIAFTVLLSAHQICI